MAASILRPDTQRLLVLLSKLPESQLVIAISQYEELTLHISNALQDLAAASLNQANAGLHEQSALIADLVRRLISRGDPSLVKKLLPSQASMIDLAICTDAKDVLARLLDETMAEECIEAAILAFRKASEGQISGEKKQIQRIDRAARALARVASSMPRHKVAEEKLTKAQKDNKVKMVKKLCGALQCLSETYERITKSQPADQAGEDKLLCKVALLDAANSVSERLLSQATGTTIKEISNHLMTSLSSAREDWKNGSEALIDLPLIADLLLIRPGLFQMIRLDPSQPSYAILFEVKTQVGRILKGQTSDKILDVPDTAWTRVVLAMSKQVDQADSPDDIIESILDILPHLATHRDELRRRLQSSEFAEKSTEDIIGILLQEEDDKAGSLANEDTREQMESIRILRERANIFNDEPLMNATVTRGKAADRDNTRLELSSGLSEEMRAAILARAEQPDSDEEEEWNPFGGRAYEVGFEEELEVEPESTSNAKMGSSRDTDDEEMEDEGEEAEGDGSRGAAGHGSGAGRESNSVAAERAAERILISAWSEKGEAFFKKEARKTAARLELVRKLNDLPGRKWDDGLVESWATMFARNPRKEKLLSAVDDIMRVGNTNRTSDGDAAFGPNRGRGGRILTGDRGYSRGGRGRGQSRGRGNRGGAAARRGRGGT